MSYVKQTWNTGDVVTAEKLNHIEDGIAGVQPATPASYYSSSETTSDFLNGIVFTQGGIDSSTGEETVSNDAIRSPFLKGDNDNIFMIHYPSASTTYACYIYYYDLDKNFNEYTSVQANTSTYQNDLTFSAGSGYFRVVIYKRAGGALTPDITPDFKIHAMHLNNKITLKVATHNIRNFGSEYGFGYTGDYTTNFNWYKEAYGSLDVDVIGFQEFSPWIDRNHTKPCSNVTSLFFDRMYTCPTSASRTPIAFFKDRLSRLDGKVKEVRNFYFSTRRNAIIIDLEFTNGKVVTIINAHTTNWVSKTESIQVTEYGELIQEMNKYENVILLGDLNGKSGSYTNYYYMFTDAGYKLVNNLNYVTEKDHNWPDDNIIVSPNINIVSSGMYTDFGTSDHKILYATLELFGDGVKIV